MAHLIHVWHERNGWSHKVLPALADSLNLGRIHNSQISNLRNGKLFSPGPEVFLAFALINNVLYQGINPIRDHLEKDHPELLRVLLESSLPLVGDDEQPLSAGDLFEIFVGLTPLPSSFDWFIEENEAVMLSAALADYLCNKRPWRQCRQKVMEAYPVQKTNRRERFAAVMAGLRDYTAEELDGELLDLYATHQKISNSDLQGADAFLEDLRIRADFLRELEQA
ncbi:MULTISPECIES: hypothetical protein [Prochlorococcus]|uniref:hypothetical protein n=2 Tax=Prochlorococcus TaxID=1218 RepID=UPI000533BC19|nr:MULTISPECIES: hypothetical protein [Prochlorococcus]KGG13701.1 hypothetical protein EV05_0359 [Prochlorococcus sp. MIT 0601]